MNATLPILEPEKTKDGAVSTNPSQFKEIRDFFNLNRKEQVEFLNKKMPNWNLLTEGRIKDLLAEKSF